jgi:hypothetical protein
VLGQQIIDALVTEWWTGLDANGQPSPFANFVDLGGILGLQRRLDVDMLQAMICRAWGGANFVRIRIALGSDGEPDVRIELEDAAHVVLQQRWRPPVGDLSAVHDRGVRVSQSRRPELVALRAAHVADAMAATPNNMTIDETGPALAALRSRRAELNDLVEAGAPGANGELASLIAKINQITTRHNQLHQLSNPGPAKPGRS